TTDDRRRTADDGRCRLTANDFDKFLKNIITDFIHRQTVHHISTVRRPLSAVSRSPSIVRRQSSAVRRQSSAVSRPPSVVRRLPSAVRRPPSAPSRGTKRPPCSSDIFN
ncbi:MAG TPA: hypothetical protein ENJ53_05795, partial [Phaeodactylibacter sp.]|nr:hypothetical protein [Phaeodactylibacter sp.]